MTGVISWTGGVLPRVIAPERIFVVEAVST